MNQVSYYPLFSSNVFDCSIEEIKILDELYDIAKKYKFPKDQGLIKTSKSTEDKRVLENHLEIKQIILDYFYKINNSTFNYSCQFEITTSWFTKCEKDDFSQYHAHKNSFYSGVLYFGNYKLNSSPIEFESPIVQMQDFLILPNEWNILNCFNWKIYPSKGKLIFFPSYLKHKIDVHTDPITRYSLAFNIVPIGMYGIGDSMYDTNWNCQNTKINK